MLPAASLPIDCQSLPFPPVSFSKLHPTPTLTSRTTCELCVGVHHSLSLAASLNSGPFPWHCCFCHVLADVTSADTMSPPGARTGQFPLGLTAKAFFLPLSCHTLLGLLPVLRGTDVGAYLQSRPVRSRCPPSSTAGCDQTKQGLRLHICGQTMDHTGGANQDADSLWAWFLSREGQPQFGKGSSSWNGLLFPPLPSFLLWFVQHKCMHRTKENQELLNWKWAANPAKVVFLYKGPTSSILLGTVRKYRELSIFLIKELKPFFMSCLPQVRMVGHD